MQYIIGKYTVQYIKGEYAVQYITGEYTVHNFGIYNWVDKR